MGLSYPRDESIDIISLRSLKKLIGVKIMSLSSPWDDYLDIIALNLVFKNLGLTQGELLTLVTTLLIILPFSQ